MSHYLPQNSVLLSVFFCVLRHKLYDLFTGQWNFHFKVEMAINHAFEEYIQNDGEHTNNNPVVASPRDNKVRPYFVIYLS